MIKISKLKFKDNIFNLTKNNLIILKIKLNNL